ncbi:helix-turn-helix domain-containing protein [Thermomicrobium sp. 4228-Ro]|uniref:substrate-binding domain-containing protein n=1 Tax=Thermomicrobium sp. 4228-Ro TaxID=2993937 RepID=UPI002248E3DA|nr:substrate-binding domain-containing protein [Thermomicrobium sp. 4228-Ro]MCX2728225.1 helix-turn-helix domain-containing protein [Thermomicrobium sp. 4228-Ro]
MQEQPELVVNVRARRQALGLTQQQLAERAGISRQTLVAIEAGRLTPSVTVALRLARALGCTVDDLFALAEPPLLEAQLALGERWSVPVPSRAHLARVGETIVAWPVRDEGGEAEGVIRERTGDRVTVELLVDPATLERSLVLAGCDPALAMLAAHLRRWHRGLRVLWVPLGSRGALRALAEGWVHVAGTHLWDPEAGEFNLPEVRRQLAGRPVAVVTLSRWVEGLGLAPGNPKQIRSVADLARPDVMLVNREPGSGSRLLLDTAMQNAGLAPSSLPGYDRELPGHRAVAEAIASRLADAGPLAFPVARSYGLSFLPLLEERYDLVVPLEYLDWPPVRDLLELLASRPVRRELEASGYDVHESGVLVARIGA